MRVFVTLVVIVLSLPFQSFGADSAAINIEKSTAWSLMITCDSMLLFFRDQDQDGWGNDMDTVSSCSAPAGYVSISGDCDDSNNQIYPGASESCNNGDDNCDGEVDEYVMFQFYKDVDADGFGDLNNMVLACTQPEGFVENTSDCDDSALTYEDLDGDGFGSEVTVACGVLVSGDCDDTMLLFEDLDNDGFGGQEYAACGMMVSDDCDDSDPTVSPAGNEICNTLDDNCNGEIDEGVLSTFYHDADLDGFGDINSIVLACEPAEGYVNNAEDCDDTQLTYIDNDGDSFGGSEWAACGVSNADDCDDNVLTYLDTDGDGFGSTNLDACGVFNFDDCDDANTEINPSVQEICNQLDDNCNIEVDENVLISFYADMDNDGFGDINNTVQACILMPGYVDNGLDCDDGQLLYSDLDSDGFGGQVLDACGVATNSDCIDFDDSVNPGAVELCDNIDQNCNGIIDEGLLLPFYWDADADGYGDINAMIEACAAATGYVSDSTDCNDADAQINPGMAEIADNNIDENCDGQIATLIAESKIEMNIFPNPAALQAVIEKSNGELGNLKVYDVMGNQVLNIMVNASRYTMETADWSNGIYLIEMGTEKYRLTVSH